jgi:hypothetical protein
VGADRVVNVLLVVEPDPDLDPDAGERLARRLRSELAELEVEPVALAAGAYTQRHTGGRAE